MEEIMVTTNRMVGKIELDDEEWSKRGFSLEHLDEDTREKLMALIRGYHDLFLEDDVVLTSATEVKHSITSEPGAHPICKAPYRIPYHQREVLQKKKIYCWILRLSAHHLVHGQLLSCWLQKNCRMERRKHGSPKRLLTDRGANFTSSLFKEVCKVLGIEKLQTASYAPTTNGQIERMHRVLKDMLSHYISENQRDWDNWIPFVLMAYRGVHKFHRLQPFFSSMGETKYPNG
ncbi:hypothetical protein JTB14_008946 [Gonioctena quinquepunctata]|nr:hypothetical protein JTB14_008946 [Gonioctena quinquepunctata]